MESEAHSVTQMKHIRTIFWYVWICRWLY